MEPQAALTLLEAAARAAGETASRWFRDGRTTTAAIRYKAGDSPVSEADIAADTVLERLLKDAYPAIGWISEEASHTRPTDESGLTFIVDPIDGTRAFIAGDPQWSVSVALAQHGRPLAGVVHAPALGQTYAAAQGLGATLNGRPIACSAAIALAGAVVAGPKPLLDAMAGRSAGGWTRAARVPSLALRLVRAADASLDGAIASEGAHAWDIAAADIILAEAGGVIFGLDRERPRYVAESLRHGVLAAGPRPIVEALLSAAGLPS